MFNTSGKCVLFLHKNVFIFQVVDDSTINKLCSVMVESGQQHAAKHLSKSPLMYAYYGTEYLGNIL